MKLIKLTAICLAFFLAFSDASANSKIQSVEPPFWWAGMVSDQLQLMVYGENIGDYQSVMIAKASNSSPKVIDVRSAENPNYLFVQLKLPATHVAGDVDLIFKSTNGAELTYRYTFKQRNDGSAQREGFSSKDVIYLVTPDRFANGDPSNDNFDDLYEQTDRANPDGRHGGDLAGLTQSLEYLAQLGVTKVWLNPLQENNQEEYSYHGYSISDLYNIDARFGGNDALLAFTRRAKEFGIGLIMDTIPNHIGLNHWWMKDLPSKDWVNNEGVFTQTSHRHEMIQDPYAPESDKKAFNDGWFVPTMPDLNQRNSDLATYFIQNNIWWVEHADLVGLRVDTLPYAEQDFTRLFNQRVLAEYPKLNIVGEEWSINPAIVSYWQQGKKNQNGFDAGTPSLMDFPLQDALIKSLNAGESDSSQGITQLHLAIANDFQYPNPNNLVVIADNHDMSRLYTLVDEDIQRYKMALTFLMTTRGIPQLFYGTEVLMKNPGTDAHGVIRSDFPGGWDGDKANAFTSQGMSDEQLKAQDFVKTLLNWRKRTTAIHSGSLVHYLPENGVYTYFREDSKSLVMVAMNNNDTATQLNTTRFSEVTADVKSVLDIFTNKRTEFVDLIEVPAKTAVVFELEK